MAKPSRWIDQDFDDEKVRWDFRRALRRRKELVTPYWKSSFNDWLVYKGAIFPCGVKVKEISSTYCTFEADSSGVQSEGICLIAEFRIETYRFTRKDLTQMVRGFEFHPKGERLMALFDTKNITSLTWFYDGSYDDSED